MTDEHPVGKEFKLKNDLGLEAVITIKEDRRNMDRNGMDFDEIITVMDKGYVCAKAEFLAEGYIEGYTACTREHDPEILIRLGGREKRVNWLAYSCDPIDYRTYKENPLWRDFFCWQREKGENRERIIGCLLNKLSRFTPSM